MKNNMKYLDKLPQHKYPWLPTLYSLIITFKPKKIIEYGTEHGGTAIVMALALKELYETENHLGKIFTYDTFEQQSKGEIGSNPNYQLAISNISNYNPSVREFINVDRGDFFEFNKDPNKQYDLLYFDIDNDGEKLLEMYNNNVVIVLSLLVTSSFSWCLMLFMLFMFRVCYVVLTEMEK